MVSIKWMILALVFVTGVETALLLRPFLTDDGRNVVETKKMGKMEMLMLDASRRSIVVSQDGQFCAEPVPDAANTLAKEFASKISGAAADRNAAAELSQLVNVDISKLFERSQGIQALRDGMYRLCEAYINKAISEDTYQEHIANLTATLNFIVPIELCSKLNREIVLAISNASNPRRIITASEEAFNAKPADNSNNGATDSSDMKAKEPSQTSKGQDGADETGRGRGWPAVMNSSELLTSKLTSSCMNIGSEFASRMAATSNILASARYEARFNAQAGKERASATPSPAAGPTR
jgi:hypothetical protein